MKRSTPPTPQCCLGGLFSDLKTSLTKTVPQTTLDMPQSTEKRKETNFTDVCEAKQEYQLILSPGALPHVSLF